MTTTLARGQTFNNVWLPEHPYAADNYTAGIYRMERKKALQHAHISPNSTTQISLLALDIDRADAVLSVLEDNAELLPNFVTENPNNGHAHAIWALRTPVTISCKGRKAPKDYLAAAHEGLRREFNGDPGYSGVLTKNPFHPAWIHRHSYSRPPYTLGELSSALEFRGSMPGHSWQLQAQDNNELSGLGRNCALFDSVRIEAYKAVRSYRGMPDGATRFTAHVEALALTQNQDSGFYSPLADQEVRAIAKSISKWIINESGMWDGDNPNWLKRQKARSAKGNAVKSAQKSERIAMARMAWMRSGRTLSNRELAESVGMSVSWVQMNREAIKV